VQRGNQFVSGLLNLSKGYGAENKELLLYALMGMIFILCWPEIKYATQAITGN
jgi:hypothetical protein